MAAQQEHVIETSMYKLLNNCLNDSSIGLKIQVDDVKFKCKTIYSIKYTAIHYNPSNMFIAFAINNYTIQMIGLPIINPI